MVGLGSWSVAKSRWLLPVGRRDGTFRGAEPLNF